MRYSLLLLFIFLMYTANAQKSGIVVKVQNKSISATLHGDNTGKTLAINSKAKPAKTDKFTIYNADWHTEKDWIRHFEIFDQNDNSITQLSTVRQAYYEIALSDLLKKVKNHQTYSLYTIAIPADPDKAATIRVRRIFICKIIVK